MKDNRVKTSFILENHVPSFVREEYPLFIEFLKKYYDSIEYQGAPKDLIENIDEYTKVNNLTNRVSSTTLVGDIETYSNNIIVESVKGFPKKSGLIQINDEIIYYTSKNSETNTFEDCSRGFTGRILNDVGTNQLEFKVTSSSTHTSGSTVSNLGEQFLQIFLEKTKKLLVPGFDSRQFVEGLDEELFIKQARDFYSAKGTPESFNVLFKALFGVESKVTNPYDYVIEPSNADYRTDSVITVEIINGDPTKVLNKTVYQDQYEGITAAYGTINGILRILEDNREYYRLSLDNNFEFGESSIFGSFTAHPSTFLMSSVSIGQDTLDVESTIGFPESGTIFVKSVDDVDSYITYTSKSTTQFFGCSGIGRLIDSKTRISLDAYAYVYGDDENDIITMRVTGILSELSYPDDVKSMLKDDTIEISSLGYLDLTDFRSNNWIINQPKKHNIKSLNHLGGFRYELETFDNLNAITGDVITLVGIVKDSFGNLENVTKDYEAIGGSNPTNTVRIINNVEIVYVYSIEKQLKKVPGLKYNADVQNTYVDSDKNTYVTSPSLPRYYNESFDLRSRVSSFDANLDSDDTIPVSNHGFLTGDAVVYFPDEDDSNNSLDIPKDIYFVKKVDNDRIKLSKSRSDIFNSDFLKISGIATNNTFAPLEFTEVDVVDGGLKFREIDSQEIVRKIQTPQLTENSFKTKPGKTGVLLNGVEILNYKSSNSIKFGPLTEIIVTASGQNYDVINPPLVHIFDQVGSGATAFSRVTGSLSRVDIIDPGYDYLTTPFISVSGGNGTGALLGANLVAYRHKVEFNAIAQAQRVDLNINVITFSKNHQFRDGEKVIYNTQGGAALGGLVNNSVYYVSIVSSRQVKLHRSLEDALAAKITYDPEIGIVPGVQNQIAFTSFGSGNHTLESYKRRKRLGEVRVLNSGKNYSNKKTLFNESNVNVYDNKITLKDHGYNSGEIIVYSSTSPIGGLEDSSSYYVTSVDGDNIRLSLIGSGNIDKNFYYVNKIYIDFTSDGNGSFNYRPITIDVSGNIGISSYYFTGVNTTASFNGDIPNFIGISTSNIKVGQTVNQLNGYIAPDTKVTSIGIGSIGINTSHSISAGSTSTAPVSLSEFIDFRANLIPVFRGEIHSLTLEQNGINYGSPDILNYDRQPNIELTDGSEAAAIPIINQGSIKEVIIQNTGKYYRSQPDIEVIGDGVGATLSAVVDSNGKVAEIVVVNGGLGYNQNNTRIRIITSGVGANFDAKITTWNINVFSRLLNSEQISNDGGVLSKGRRGLQYTHPYAPRTLRSEIYSVKNISETVNLYQSDAENDTTDILFHSPIIGWAYDGNPIYGPYGYSNPTRGGLITQMKSGYSSRRLENRPPSFPTGFFIEDYQFTNAGTLDIHNGRYCKTPEYPNGTYAYFSTFTPNVLDSGPFNREKFPQFPYLIGDSFRSQPIDFNFSNSSNQRDFDFVENGLIRNTEYYSLTSENSEYPYFVNSYKIRKQLTDVKASSVGNVDGINIISGGDGYKIGDKILFDNSKTSGGFGAYAVVSEISGKTIDRVESETTILKDVEIIKSTEGPEDYIFISEQPHGFDSQEIVSISGINTDAVTFKNSYPITILSNTLQLKSGLSTSATTGIVTTFEVSGNFNSPSLLINDFYKIGNEVVKVIGINALNSTITVLRNTNEQDGFYDGGSFLVEESRKFEVYDQYKDYSFKKTSQVYFDPNKTLGIGTVGITTTLFLNTVGSGSSVSVGIGTTTDIFFVNLPEVNNFRSGGYVNLESNVNGLSGERKKILSVGTTSINLDFDTSGVSYSGEICTLIKWNSITLDSGSLHLPNHGYVTGQELKYNPNVGTGITVSLDGVENFALTADQKVYVAKIDNNIIGISTTGVGIGSDGSFVGIGTTNPQLLYFVGFGTGTYHSFKYEPDNIVKVDVNQHLNKVFTLEDHNILFEDKVNVQCYPTITDTFVIRYDDTNRILVTKENNFSDQNVDVEKSAITIQGHGYYNGEKVLHTSNAPTGGLEDNKIYYINVLDSDRIKLSSSYYNRSQSIINLTSQSYGKISSINPKIKATKGKLIKFDLTDSSLSYFKGSKRFPAFTFDIFSDNKFKSTFTSTPGTGSFELARYGDIGVTEDASTTITVTESLPSKLFYKLTPVFDSEGLPDTKREIVVSDDSNPEHSTIEKLDSVFSGLHRIVGISSTSFSYTTDNPTENSSYQKNEGFLSYTTSSTNASGPIVKTKFESTGQRYKKLPFIKDVISTSGTNALLYPTSTNIGKVLTTKLAGDPGYDYPTDGTLKPQAKFPQIIKVDPLASFVSIDVVNPGVNYSTYPDLVVKDGFTGKVVKDLTLSYETGARRVKIITNTTGIYDVTPKLIPINNSNGIRIETITYDKTTNKASLILEPDYSSIDDFPFAVGDKFLLEYIVTIDEVGFTNTGYSSSGYEYYLYTVESIDPNIGGSNATVVFNMSDVIESSTNSPGVFAESNNFARIIPESYFPVFNAKLQKNNFLVGEKVERESSDANAVLSRLYPTNITQNLDDITTRNQLDYLQSIVGVISGQVEDWDFENQSIKISSDKFFRIGDTIKGSSSNSKAIITNTLDYTGNYNIGAVANIEKGWLKRTGFLNDSLQRIHDNDYYQALSYAINSTISIDKWDDAVTTLLHPSGFKKFSDLIVETTAESGISSTQNFSDFSSQVILSSLVDTHSIHDFDLATEEGDLFEGKNISEFINLNSKLIQDYAKSVGNKVLMVDDISQSFNSLPRDTKFSIVNKFRISDFRIRKYVIGVRDKRFTSQKELLLITLLQTGNEVYLNQYGRSDTFDDLGYFDAQIVGEEIQLLFYPNRFEINNYSTTFISFDLDLTHESGSLSLGDAIELVTGSTPVLTGIAQTTLLTIPTTNRSSKILIGYGKTTGKYELDELSLIHDGTNIEFLEYGQISNQVSGSTESVGFGTYSAYISGSNINLDLNLNDVSADMVVDYLLINSSASPTGVASTSVNTGIVESFYTSIPSSPSPTSTTVAQYSNYSSGISSEGIGAYLFATVSDTTNSKYESLELCVATNDLDTPITEYAILQTDSGDRLGTFDSESDGTNTYIKFTPVSNIDVNVTILQTSVRVPTTFYDETSIDI